MVVILQSGCFRIRVVVFGQEWLSLGKNGCIRADVVVFGQRWLYSGKNSYILAKWFSSGKVVVLGQK